MTVGKRKYPIFEKWFDRVAGLIYCPKTPNEMAERFMLMNRLDRTTRKFTMPCGKSMKSVVVTWKICCAKSVYKDFGKILQYCTFCVILQFSYQLILSHIDITELDEAYNYINSGVDGSERTLSDPIGPRRKTVPKRFCDTEIRPVETKKAKKNVEKSKPKSSNM